MPYKKIKSNSSGNIIQVELPDDYPITVSGTIATFVFQKPDESIVEKSGYITVSGIINYAEYIVEKDFLSQTGHWKYGVTIADPLSEYDTDIFSITVIGNLK